MSLRFTGAEDGKTISGMIWSCSRCLVCGRRVDLVAVSEDVESFDGLNVVVKCHGQIWRQRITIEDIASGVCCITVPPPELKQIAS